MQIINCKQNTEEWYQARLGIPTASNFTKIVTSKGEKSKTFKDYAFQVASELLTTEQEEIYKSDAMQRGNDLEDEARQAYQEETFNIVNEIGFIKCNHYGYSPDGLIGDDGLIEIKCPKQNTHMKYLHNRALPSIYKAQVQGGLLATNRKWCDFVSYHPNFIDDARLLIVRVFKDDDFIKSLNQLLVEFNELKNNILKPTHWEIQQKGADLNTNK